MRFTLIVPDGTMAINGVGHQINVSSAPYGHFCETYVFNPSVVTFFNFLLNRLTVSIACFYTASLDGVSRQGSQNH